jgi:PAS domain-containing protein
MNSDPSTFNSNTTINRLRDLLNEYRGRTLDENLSEKIENVFLGIEAGVAEQGAQITKISENREQQKERRGLERRNKDKIIEVIGIGLCLLDKELRITWINQTLCDWLNLKDSPVGKSCHDIYHCDQIGTGICPAANVFNGNVSNIIETWIE